MRDGLATNDESAAQRSGREAPARPDFSGQKHGQNPKSAIGNFFGVSGEPDDPAVGEEDEGAIVRQRRVNSPRNVGLSKTGLIRWEPMRRNDHATILSALTLIGK